MLAQTAQISYHTSHRKLVYYENCLIKLSKDIYKSWMENDPAPLYG